MESPSGITVKRKRIEEVFELKCCVKSLNVRYRNLGNVYCLPERGCVVDSKK